MALDLSAQRRKGKKDEEPRTQVLEPLPDPPDSVVAEAAKLSFQISPLSAKGLLSQQLRDAIKALLHDSHGATLVKLRALVAGSGDLRRVQAIVSEEFSDRKLALPAVSTIQVGALPMVGAQVVLEATAIEKKVINPNGIAFLSTTGANGASEAIESLRRQSSGLEVLRVTCFLSSLDDLPSIRSAVGTAFPAAMTNFVQSQRQAIEPRSHCDGAGRIQPGFLPEPNRNVAAVTSARIVMTGTKLVFRDQDADVRLTFQRLAKSLESHGATMKDVFWVEAFSLTRPMDDKIAALRGEFLDGTRPPPGLSLIVEGLPSTDATAAIELIATVR